MRFDEKLAVKKRAEKLKISDSKWAWVLPEIKNYRKMIAYARNNEVVWVHPDWEKR
jgi:hypothetical protein